MVSHTDHSGYNRLEDQIAWYDKKSQSAQWWFKATKIFTIVAAASVPILIFLEYEFVAACTGAVIAVAEGLNHLNQWQHNWITYRSTCEALRHEKFTYIEAADPYDLEDAADRRKLLVERVESLISTEHSKWIAGQDDGGKTTADKSGAPKGV